MPEEKKSRLLGLALVVLATACWSTSGIFINFIIDGSTVSPVMLAFWRDLGTFVSLLIALVLVKPEMLRVKRRDLPWLAAMGAISIGLFHVLWNTAVTTIGASVSTVIQCNAPVFVTLMAWFIWQEPLTWRKIIAILLAAAGTAMIAQLDQAGTEEITLIGVLIALGSAIAYGTFSLLGKKLSGSYSNWTILVYVFGFGALALSPFGLSAGLPQNLSAPTLGYFAALVLLTTISGFGLYTAGLRRLQASVASITANTEVPFAAIMAYFLLGERLGAWQVIGAALVIGGVVLLSLPEQAVQRLRSRLQYSR